jgi:hypothetical protein
VDEVAAGGGRRSVHPVTEDTDIMDLNEMPELPDPFFVYPYSIDA